MLHDNANTLTKIATSKSAHHQHASRASIKNHQHSSDPADTTHSFSHPYTSRPRQFSTASFDTYSSTDQHSPAAMSTHSLHIHPGTENSMDGISPMRSEFGHSFANGDHHADNPAFPTSPHDYRRLRRDSATKNHVSTPAPPQSQPKRKFFLRHNKQRSLTVSGLKMSDSEAAAIAATSSPHNDFSFLAASSSRPAPGRSSRKASTASISSTASSATSTSGPSSGPTSTFERILSKRSSLNFSDSKNFLRSKSSLPQIAPTSTSSTASSASSQQSPQSQALPAKETQQHLYPELQQSASNKAPSPSVSPTAVSFSHSPDIFNHQYPGRPQQQTGGLRYSGNASSSTLPLSSQTVPQTVFLVRDEAADEPVQLQNAPHRRSPSVAEPAGHHHHPFSSNAYSIFSSFSRKHAAAPANSGAASPTHPTPPLQTSTSSSRLRQSATFSNFQTVITNTSYKHNGRQARLADTPEDTVDEEESQTEAEPATAPIAIAPSSAATSISAQSIRENSGASSPESSAPGCSAFNISNPSLTITRPGEVVAGNRNSAPRAASGGSSTIELPSRMSLRREFMVSSTSLRKEPLSPIMPQHSSVPATPSTPTTPNLPQTHSPKSPVSPLKRARTGGLIAGSPAASPLPVVSSPIATPPPDAAEQEYAGNTFVGAIVGGKVDQDATSALNSRVVSSVSPAASLESISESQPIAIGGFSKPDAITMELPVPTATSPSLPSASSTVSTGYNSMLSNDDGGLDDDDDENDSGDQSGYSSSEVSFSSFKETEEPPEDKVDVPSQVLLLDVDSKNKELATPQEPEQGEVTPLPESKKAKPPQTVKVSHGVVWIGSESHSRHRYTMSSSSVCTSLSMQDCGSYTTFATSSAVPSCSSVAVSAQPGSSVDEYDDSSFFDDDDEEEFFLNGFNNALNSDRVNTGGYTGYSFTFGKASSVYESEDDLTTTSFIIEPPSMASLMTPTTPTTPMTPTTSSGLKNTFKKKLRRGSASTSGSSKRDKFFIGHAKRTSVESNRNTIAIV